MTVTKRSIIRICSLSLAAVGVLGIKGFQLEHENEKAERMAAYAYTRAVEELATAAENINSNLQKQLYSSTAQYSDELAIRLRENAASAKSALEQLPVSDAQIAGCEKFLSQVGNFAVAVSQKRSGDEVYKDEYDQDDEDTSVQSYDFSDDDLDALKQLYDISGQLSDVMWKLERGVSSGLINISELGKILENQEVPSVFNGFTDFESNSESFPQLVYDGPFSDQILEKEPVMTKGRDEIDENTALMKAAMCLEINSADLTQISLSEGKMPCYNISDSDGEASVTVTKYGGFISTMIRHREVDSAKISSEQAIEAAEKFMEHVGISSMERSYYERYGDTLLVNFVYKQGDTLVYPDMIKISVALDNGEILGYDAQGYITNHCSRKTDDIRCDYMDALDLISENLNVLSRKMAIVPTEGTSESLCHEFICEASDGTHVIVYINARSGKEEKILILQESENGVLAI